MFWNDFNKESLADCAGKTLTWVRMDNEAALSFTKRKKLGETYSAEDFNYKFNSLGFRSEEFVNTENVKILYSGCSVTEGIGLPQEHTWCHFLNDKIAKHIGYMPSMFNIGKGGLSISGCVRYIYVLIEQYDFTPDIVILLIPPLQRNELFYGVSGNTKIADFSPNNERFDCNEDKIAHNSYLKNLSLTQCVSESIKNLLFLKYYLQSKGIPFVFSSWQQMPQVDDQSGFNKTNIEIFENEIKTGLADHFISAPLQQDKYQHIGPIHPLYRVDLDAEMPFKQQIARDGLHYGPNAHWNFSRVFFEKFKKSEHFKKLKTNHEEKNSLFRN